MSFRRRSGNFVGLGYVMLKRTVNTKLEVEILPLSHLSTASSTQVWRGRGDDAAAGRCRIPAAARRMDLGVLSGESSSGRLLDLSDEVHVDVVLQLLHRLLLVAAEDAAETLCIAGTAASTFRRWGALHFLNGKKKGGKF